MSSNRQNLMFIKEIINLNVYTQSGYYLGRIVDLEIDPDNSRIEKYIIKSRNFIKNLFQDCLVINYTQVISISKKKMIVEDSVKRVKQAVPSPAR